MNFGALFWLDVLLIIDRNLVEDAVRGVPVLLTEGDEGFTRLGVEERQITVDRVFSNNVALAIPDFLLR